MNPRSGFFLVLLLFAGNLTAQDAAFTGSLIELLRGPRAKTDLTHALSGSPLDDFELLDFLDELPGVGELRMKIAASVLCSYAEEHPDQVEQLLPELEHRFASSDPKIQRGVVSLLSGLGQRAHPAQHLLLSGVVDPDRRVREASFAVLIELPFLPRRLLLPLVLEWIEDREGQSQDEILRFLHDCGESAKEAVPWVQKVLREAGNRRAWILQVSAMSTLCAIGDGDPSVLDDLLLLLADPEPVTRRRAMSGVLALTGSAKARQSVCQAAVREIKRVRLESPHEISDYVSILGECGITALEPLKTLGSSSNRRIRMLAAVELANVDPGGEESVALLIRAFTQQSLDQSRTNAPCGNFYQALTETGEALVRVGAGVVDDLSSLMQHWDPFVRYKTVQVLAHIRPMTEKAGRLLLLALDDKSDMVAKAAFSGFTGLDAFPADVSRALVAIVENKARSEEVRERAIEALARLGLQDEVMSIVLDEQTPEFLRRSGFLAVRESLEPSLLACLVRDAPSIPLRILAIESVGEFPEVLEETRELLLELVHGDWIDSDLAEAAKTALIVTGDPRMAPMVVKAVLEFDPEENSFDWDLLEYLNLRSPAPESVVPKLVSLFVHEDGDLDLGIGETLAAYGEKAASARPMAIRRFQEGDWFEQRASLSLIVAIDGDRAGESLRQLLRDEDLSAEQLTMVFEHLLEFDDDAERLVKDLADLGERRRKLSNGCLMEIALSLGPFVSRWKSLYELRILGGDLTVEEGIAAMGLILAETKEIPRSLERIGLTLEDEKETDALKTLALARAAIVGDVKAVAELRLLLRELYPDEVD